MKKKEKIIIIIFIIVASLGLFLINYFQSNKEEGYGVVYFQNKEILKFDIYETQTYQFLGSYGDVFLEVDNGTWRITREECPNHICSSMGWVTKDTFIPITCLPNEIVVVYEEVE